MLNQNEKIEILKTYLLDIKNNYADSFKTDIMFYFDEFDNLEENNIKLNVLKGLHSKNDIQNWTDNLTSKIVLKHNEDEEQLSDFIFYNITRL